MTTAFADPVVDRAVAGDDAAFSALVERHRRELHGHCRRLLSAERAEDALQEALLRAWRSRGHFAGRATFRTWLYRIATNTCLDEMHRPQTFELGEREPASPEPGPDALLETGEAIETACRTIIALLPPKQRAVLVLCEVLRCSSSEAAQQLGTTVAAVNSARQRARATLGSARRLEPDSRLGATEQALLKRYVGAIRRYDVSAIMALARADGGSTVSRRPDGARRDGTRG